MNADPSPLLPLIPDDLQALLGLAELQPLFRTTVRRHTRRLTVAGTELEIAFDQGLIEADSGSVPISEIELELRHGSAGALFEVASRLAEVAPLRPSLCSKAERGAALIHNRPLPSHRIPHLRLESGLSLDDALWTILHSIFGHFLANLAAAEEMRDPEGVHQVRVALRRLRAALAQIARFAPAPTLDFLRAEARWLARSIAPARNWDLFVLELLPAVVAAVPQLAGFDELAEAAAQNRTAAHRSAAVALTDERAGRFAIALGGWIESRGWRVGASDEAAIALAAPALVFAVPLLVRRHRKVMKSGRHFAHLSPPARHRLRIGVKKLRYNVDFFFPLEDGLKSSRRFLRRLGRLQTLLGIFNDMTTTPERAAELAQLPLSNEAVLALGAVIGWQARGRANIEPKLKAAWRRFRRAEPPWSSWSVPPAGGLVSSPQALR